METTIAPLSEKFGIESQEVHGYFYVSLFPNHFLAARIALNLLTRLGNSTSSISSTSESSLV